MAPPRKGRPPVQAHKVELKGLPEALVGSKLAESLGKVAPDLAILGGGFFLGFALNTRPGIEIPLPLGPLFLGLPDFGDRIRELQEDVANQERIVDVLEPPEDCLARCEEFRRNFGFTQEEVDQCIADCQQRNLESPDAAARKKLADLNAELTKLRIGQGILMAIIAYVLTRPGFLTGIGEIIPG